MNLISLISYLIHLNGFVYSQQEETQTEGMEQFRLVTDIVNPNVNKLRRMGLLTGLAIAIHNFPEGLATFVATLSDPSLGELIK